MTIFDVCPIEPTRERVVVTIAGITLVSSAPKGSGPYSWRVTHGEGSRRVEVRNRVGERIGMAVMAVPS